MCLRNVCGLRRITKKLINESEARLRVESIGKSGSKWFGHVERRVKNIHKATVEGNGGEGDHKKVERGIEGSTDGWGEIK